MIVPAHQLFAYRGLSMWPCFQDGDLLEVIPLPTAALRAGDCVVLRTSDGRHIAHRLVGRQGSLRTRGDAMAHEDYYGTESPQLVGRIVARHRLGERSAVAGGRRGQLAAVFYRYAGRIDPERQGRGGRLARKVRTSCTPWLRPLLRLDMAQFGEGSKRTELTVWKLGGYIVAVRTGSTGTWRARWPWRNFVNGPWEESFRP